jgi:hypothetical protein
LKTINATVKRVRPTAALRASPESTTVAPTAAQMAEPKVPLMAALRESLESMTAEPTVAQMAARMAMGEPTAELNR